MKSDICKNWIKEISKTTSHQYGQESANQGRDWHISIYDKSTILFY